MKLERNQIKLKAHAKINLCLYITGIRDDGYHLLDSIFVPISIYDGIDISKSGDGIHLRCDKDIPSDKSNTAYKAAQLLMEASDIKGVEITIKKNIPAMAGLGGGSADAAAVLTGMNVLFKLGISEEELAGLGLRIGADVPFFLGGGASRVQGIGEILEPIDIKKEINLAVIRPKQPLSTPEVYKKFDETGERQENRCGEIAALLEKGEYKSAFGMLGNDLEAPASIICPEVENAIRYLEKNGAQTALMTGSGSCVFGIFESKKGAEKAISQYEGEGEIFSAGSVRFPVEIS